MKDDCRDHDDDVLSEVREYLSESSRDFCIEGINLCLFSLLPFALLLSHPFALHPRNHTRSLLVLLLCTLFTVIFIFVITNNNNIP